MQNIDVRFNATTNFGQAQAQIVALSDEVKTLNARLEKARKGGVTSGAPGGIAPAAWARNTKAVEEFGRAYRDAASSTGVLQAQQLKSMSQTERYTELLQKQKLSLKDIRNNWQQMKAVYRDQLRMQRMTILPTGTDTMGRDVMQMTMPKAVPKELNTVRQQIAFMNEGLKSASTQMVNFGKNTQWAGRQLTVGLTVPITMFGAAAAKATYDANAQITRITKVYDTSSHTAIGRMQELHKVSVDAMADGEDAAKKYGAALTDTLNVEAELAATGLKGMELRKSTAEVMRISALGELDYGDAVKTTIALQTAFRMNSKQLTETFNFMNATENATSLSLKDISEATPRAASAMAGLGVSAKEMTIMLVAMKERGVDAAEGANALKSATTRILNPTKKATEYYDKFGINLEKMSNKSNGNLFVFLKLLGQVTGTMSNLEKQRGIANLFGTYQFNRLNAAITGISDAESGLGKQSSQTARAVSVANMTAAQTAALAQRELQQQTESTSGKFKRAWAAVKVEMAQLGEPFLEFATDVAKAATGVLGFFNSLPKGVKKMAMIGAIATGIAGPLIMLIGLLGNMTGYIGKGLTIALGRLVGRFDVLTKSQNAARIMSERMQNEQKKEADTTKVLTTELMGLAEAYGYASGAALSYMDGTLGGGRAGGAAASALNAARPALGPGVSMRTTKSGEERYYREGTGRIPKPAEIKAWEKTQANIAEETRKTKVAMSDASHAAAETSTNVEKGAKSMGRMQKMGILAGASMTGMMFSSGKTADILFKISALTSGAMLAMEGYTMWQTRAAAKATETAAATETIASRGLWARAATGAKGLVMSLAGFIGVPGLLIAGAATAAVLTYRQMKAPLDRQKEINHSTQDWAKTLGLVYTGYAKIGAKQKENQKSQSMVDAADQFGSTKAGKALVDRYQGADPLAKRTIALTEFNKILQQTNGSVKDAEVAMTFLFYNSGEDMDVARQHAHAFAEEFKNVGRSAQAMGTMWRMQMTQIFNYVNSQGKLVSDSMGENMAKSIASALATAANRTQRSHIFEQLKTSLNDQWAAMLADLNNNPESAAALKKLGITTGEGLQQAFQLSRQGPDAFQARYGNSAASRTAYNGFNDRQYQQQAQQAYTLEQQIVATIAKQMGIHGNIVGLQGLEVKQAFALYTMTNKQLTNQVKAQILAANAAKLATTGVMNMFSKQKDAANGLTDAQKLQILNQYRLALNMKKATSLSEWFTQSVDKSTGAANRHAAAEEKVNRVLAARRSVFKDFDFMGAAQGAMGNVTNTVADEMSRLQDTQFTKESNALDRRIDAGSKALDRKADRADAYWSRRSDALDAHFERRGKALDAGYDKRIAAINKTVEAEKKADDIRQRLYEAELARIQRLAEAANRNIDFNVAVDTGKLDEAAKIMNDAQAATQQWGMEDSGKSADQASQARQDRAQKRVDKLEKQRAAAEDRLNKQRAAAEKHLQRQQEASRKALQAEKDRYQAEAQMRKDALADDQRKRKASLDNQLALLKAFIPRNKKELLQHMKDMGASYKQFGDVLKARGNSWAKFIGNATTHEMKIVVQDLKSKIDWATAGAAAAKGMIAGAFGMSLAQFRKWTGLKEVGTGKNNPAAKAFAKNLAIANASNNNDKRLGNTFHTGGIVGPKGNTKANARVGVPAGAAPFSNERMILAQDGEAVLNKKATDALGSQTVDRLNSGQKGLPMGAQAALPTQEIGGPSIGLPGAMAGGMATMMQYLIGNAILQRGAEQTLIDQQQSLQGATGGRFAGGTFQAGKLKGMSASQMRNASIIANVGSKMGMSKRDIEIAFMTAMVESHMQNLPYGDGSSIGMFQQIDSWGSVAKRLNPVTSSKMFFNSLKSVGGRTKMSMGEAAQAVQRSAFPGRYAQYQGLAERIFSALGHQAAGGAAGISGDVGPVGPANAIGKRAISWASARIGDAGWTYLCQKFVRTALGSGGGFPTAISAWYGAKNKHGIGNPARVPAGVPVYWGGGGAGHVALSTGGGRIISTDYPHMGRIGRGTIGGLTSAWHKPLLGWTEDINGKKIYNVPHMKVGGDVRWDNTLANLHQGERVLTKPLTDNLDRGIERMSEPGYGTLNVNFNMENIPSHIDENLLADRVVAKLEHKAGKIGRSRKVN